MPRQFPGIKHVILSVSEISHNLSEQVYALRKTTLPGVDSPDETGEVARISATKGGRAVEPASSLRFLAKTNKKVRHIERKRNIPHAFFTPY